MGTPHCAVPHYPHRHQPHSKPLTCGVVQNVVPLLLLELRSALCDAACSI